MRIACSSVASSTGRETSNLRIARCRNSKSLEPRYLLGKGLESGEGSAGSLYRLDSTGVCAFRNDLALATPAGISSFGSFQGYMESSAFGASLNMSIETWKG